MAKSPLSLLVMNYTIKLSTESSKLLTHRNSHTTDTYTIEQCEYIIFINLPMSDLYTQRKLSLHSHSSWIQLRNTRAIIKSKVQYISPMPSETLKITITTAINSTEDMNFKMQCFTFFGLRTPPNHFKTTNNDDQNITAD